MEDRVLIITELSQNRFVQKKTPDGTTKLRHGAPNLNRCNLHHRCLLMVVVAPRSVKGWERMRVE